MNPRSVGRPTLRLAMSHRGQSAACRYSSADSATSCNNLLATMELNSCVERAGLAAANCSTMCTDRAAQGGGRCLPEKAIKAVGTARQKRPLRYIRRPLHVQWRSLVAWTLEAGKPRASTICRISASVRAACSDSTNIFRCSGFGPPEYKSANRASSVSSRGRIKSRTNTTPPGASTRTASASASAGSGM